MKSELVKRFSTLENDDLYCFATYLDPRYKAKFFSSTELRRIESSLGKAVEDIRSHISATASPAKKVSFYANTFYKQIDIRVSIGISRLQ